jgi:hypothetical protein
MDDPHRSEHRKPIAGCPVDAGSDPPSEPSAWETLAAWLWITGPFMVWLASVGAVGTYLLLPPVAGSGELVPADPAAAIMIGAGVAIVTWLASALPLHGLMDAARAQPRIYMELCERLDQLRTRLPPETDANRKAVTEACVQLAYARDQLRGNGNGASLRWALGHGYISVMRSLHRAEESLVVVESDAAVVGDAVHDDLLLKMSGIANEAELRSLIRAAIDAASNGIGSSLLPEAATSVAAAAAVGAHMERESARETLRSVRHAVNVYRDDARDGLIRARGRLQWLMLAVAAMTLLLFALPIVLAVPVRFVAAAAAFYLVGATIGLFNRLRLESARTKAVDDYGLSQARLFASVLICGLAGVGGVYLVAALPALVPTGGATTPVATLETVFDLGTHQIGLIFAAVFGLVPASLPTLLVQQADRLEKVLEGSRPATNTGDADR